MKGTSGAESPARWGIGARSGRKQLWFAAAASAVFLYLAFADSSLSGIVGSLASARPIPIAFAVILVLLTSLLRGWRWQTLLSPIARTSFWLPHDICAIGFLANNVLPARAGEVVRAGLMGRMAGISRSQVFATVLLERLCDLVGLILMLAIVPWLAPQALGGLTRWNAALLSVATVVLLAGGLGLTHRLLASDAVRRRVVRMGGVVGHITQGLIDGFRVGASPMIVSVAVAQTIGVWFLVGLTFHAIAIAYDLPLDGPARGLPSALALSAITGAGSLIPSLPGQIGTFHFFAKQGLELVSTNGRALDPILADTYAVASHGLQYLTVNIVGVAALLHRGLRIGRPSEWLRIER